MDQRALLTCTAAVQSGVLLSRTTTPTEPSLVDGDVWHPVAVEVPDGHGIETA
jgi:hypothetical protein